MAICTLRATDMRQARRQDKGERSQEQEDFWHARRLLGQAQRDDDERPAGDDHGKQELALNFRARLQRLLFTKQQRTVLCYHADVAPFAVAVQTLGAQWLHTDKR